MWHTWTPLEHLLCRWVDRFIYISDAIRQAHLAQGVPAGNGLVVHNAVDFEGMTRRREAGIRAQAGWTSDEFVVGMVGRLDWWKGHEYFLRAMATLAKEHPRVRGLIVGEADQARRNRDYAANLKDLCSSLCLERHVFFAGYRDDVPDVMAELDALVLASTEPEPFGRVIIEGMAAGKPVIATNAGGVPEIIEDRRTGLLVPAKSVEALTVAMAELIENPAFCAALGRAGRQSALERFSADQQMRQIEAVYVGLLEPANPHEPLAAMIDAHAQGAKHK
jgi:glycosyltransferase involved in cell wall biosynthesis